MKQCTIGFLLTTFIFFSCNSSRHLKISERKNNAVTGNQFYHQVFSADRIQREELAKKEILEGNMPSFLKRFVRIKTSIISEDGNKIDAVYFVLPDYLSIGSDNDFARIPLSPMTAQVIADSLNCFLPTRKIVDDIYRSAKVKLEPVPMYAFRDSSVTMYQHNLIIEGQKKGKKGLIAGIKKDVVISGKISRDPKPGRVAIYGWHQLNGKPIQPLYTGHVNWYVDYSHGIRLVYRTIYINKKPVDYIDVLKDQTLRKLLCDEKNCYFYKYPVATLPAL